MVVKMNKYIKLMLIFLIILAVSSYLLSNFYTDSIDSDENTMIISVCTGDMRALETGISVYAGYKQTPLILSDKKLPEQLKEYLPEFIQQNNITKIIIIGPMNVDEIINLQRMVPEVKQVNGNTIADILTKIADNTHDINNETIIFTSSDPMAGLLGAYTKTPVFITATNSTYNSAQNLQDEYINYLETHQIKHIIIIGTLPESLTKQLREYDENLEIITGADSSHVSINVIDKLKKDGYLNNTTTAYYGFYGELPTIIPTVIKDNAILIEDSTSHADIISYLKENLIDTIIITRNQQTDYIQMEETDYISPEVIEKLEENNFNIEYLTRQRTLNEATGLYDMKIVTLEQITHNKKQLGELNSNNTLKSHNSIKSNPPLISLLDKDAWKDSNNITATVTHKSNDTIILKWNTIHPYTWTINNQNNYTQKSDNGYEYHWIKESNVWTEEYLYQNNTYYTVKWMENDDNTWTEMQPVKNYTWSYDGTTWYCYDDDKLCYYIQSSTAHQN